MKTPLFKHFLFFLIIILFGCTEENNYYTCENENPGKVNVYIEGNITNEETRAKLLAEVGTLTENIYVRNTTQLTNITITATGSMQNIEIKNTSQLTDVSINAKGSLYDVVVESNVSLANIEISGYNKSLANSIYITSNNALNNILIKEIKELNNFSLRYNGVAVNFTCHDLVDIKNNLLLYLRTDVDNAINFYDLKNVSLYSDTQNFWRGKYNVLNFPKLERINNLLLWDTYLGGVFINELYFPKLEEINSLVCYFGLEINTFNFPLLERCGTFFVNCDTSQPKNPIINLPMLNQCYEFKISHTTYNTSQINSLLNKFLTIFPVSGKNIELAYQIPVAPPTGQGIIDKQTLINQGNTVITD